MKKSKEIILRKLTLRKDISLKYQGWMNDFEVTWFWEDLHAAFVALEYSYYLERHVTAGVKAFDASHDYCTNILDFLESPTFDDPVDPVDPVYPVVLQVTLQSDQNQAIDMANHGAVAATRMAA